eukprot:gene21592-biopygen5680
MPQECRRTQECRRVDFACKTHWPQNAAGMPQECRRVKSWALHGRCLPGGLGVSRPLLRIVYSRGERRNAKQNALTAGAAEAVAAAATFRHFSCCVRSTSHGKRRPALHFGSAAAAAGAAPAEGDSPNDIAGVRSAAISGKSLALGTITLP